MTIKYPIRDSVRIILLNDKNELLLMCIDDPRTKLIGEEYRGRFWVMIGGGIEENETIGEAAFREILEETEINKNEVKLGPVVWLRELDLILYGKAAHIKEKYIVAITQKNKITSTNLTKDEIGIVKKIKWFSLSQIIAFKETIYPVSLTKHLPNILSKNYPDPPIIIE